MSTTDSDDDLSADWAAMAAEWAAMAEDDDKSQDAMAAEWEAMSDSDSDVFLNASRDLQSTRILDQEEIDSLLGFQD